ncbi:MAG: protein arginine kinase [bacterium]|nr:protein arginine kinase [bacterium]
MQIIQKLIDRTNNSLNINSLLDNIVISSRIRLARNIEEIPFTSNSNKDDRKKIFNLAKDIFDSKDIIKDSVFIDLGDYTQIERLFLVERHLVSQEHSKGGENYGVVINDTETISIMINEEDHFRLQALHSGLQLFSSWKLIDEIDEKLSKEVNYAFSPLFGYLTACPTNLGTGMRASVMLHLPALILTKQINKIIASVSKMDVIVRGLYGEGSKVLGDIFQISNQGAFGFKEEDIVKKIEEIAKYIVECEKTAREYLLKESRQVIEDKIWRAYGILKHCRTISSAESLSLISFLRLGVDLKIMPKSDIDFNFLNRMMLLIQPGHLQNIEKRRLDIKNRDILRADLIRKMLN